MASVIANPYDFQESPPSNYKCQNFMTIWRLNILEQNDFSFHSKQVSTSAIISLFDPNFFLKVVDELNYMGIPKYRADFWHIGRELFQRYNQSILSIVGRLRFIPQFPYRIDFNLHRPDLNSITDARLDSSNVKTCNIFGHHSFIK